MQCTVNEAPIRNSVFKSKFTVIPTVVSPNEGGSYLAVKALRAIIYRLFQNFFPISIVD